MKLHRMFQVTSDVLRAPPTCACSSGIDTDVFVIAQQLAMYADKMLTRQGK